MLEIEIKSYCDNHGEVLERIKSLGAHYMDSASELDIYYNHPDRDFGQTDEALRIRRRHDGYILTYKGPKVSKVSKARIEVETAVDDYEAMDAVLHHLGFSRSGTVIKERERYSYKDIEISLDSVEGIGDFVELEKKGEAKEDIEKQLFSLAEIIGLKKFERKSYLELLQESKK